MENELYHHGVTGMKWGKRNGPPYPLDAEGKAELREQKKEAKQQFKEAENLAKHDTRYKNATVVNRYRAKERTRIETALGATGAAAVGAAVGGPSGLALGLVGGMAVSAIAAGTINTGIRMYENSSYKKMLASEFIEKEHANSNIGKKHNN